MKKKLISVLVLFCVVGVTNAALQTIGTATYGGSDYKLIYDTDDQLTWLDYSRPGGDYYSGSLAWAASLNNPGQLTISLDPGYTALWGAEQWRLPQVDGWWVNSSQHQYYFTDSEIYELYYNELGNVANDPSVNTGPFDNIVVATSTSSWYWIEPTFDTGVTYKAGFNFYNGSLEGTMSVSVNGGIYAMPVISGAVVPEPATLSLLALGGLLLCKRK